MGWTNGVRFPAAVGISFSATASRPVLGPLQPNQRVPGALSPGSKTAWKWG